MQDIIAQIPRGFAVFCRVVYYVDIVSMILLAAAGGRPLLLLLLPLYLLLGFSLLFYARWIQLANRHQPSYEITDDGIRDRSSYFGPGLLFPWSEIAEVKPLNYLGFAGLKVRLKDRRAFTRRQRGSMRFMCRVNEMFYGTPLALWGVCSDVPLSEMKRAIQERTVAAMVSTPSNVGQTAPASRTYTADTAEQIVSVRRRG
jgi:hypothetical protein